MTNSDFKTWLKHHLACFTACSGWLHKFPTEARGETDVTRRDVLDQWAKTLAFTDLADAMAATDSLSSGLESFSEKAGFDHHARDVRRLAMALRGDRHRDSNTDRLRKIIDGHETVACTLCQDCGCRFCVHPASIEDFRLGKLHHREHNPEGKRVYYTTSRACKCTAGNAIRPVVGTIRDSDLEITWPPDDDWWQHVQDFADHLNAGRFETTLDGWQYTGDGQ